MLFIFFFLLRLKIAGEAARILVEFLEVASTSIVFLKGVHPNGKETQNRNY
jgi:hypothetical protein